MINSVLSEPCTASTVPNSGRSSIEPRSSPRRTPYSIPHSNSSSSLKSYSSTTSRSSSRHEGESIASPTRPKHLSNRSITSLANLTSNNNGSPNKLSGTKTGQMASLSTPTIAKQHAHAATPLTSTKRDSATLLASTAQQAGNRAPTTAPSKASNGSASSFEVKRSPGQEVAGRLSSTLNDLHVHAEKNGKNDQASLTIGNNSVITNGDHETSSYRSSHSIPSNSSSDIGRSSSESMTSSLPTSISEGQALGISLTGSQSAFEQHQMNLKNANKIGSSPSVVATQPPVPPSNAIGKGLNNGSNFAADASQSSNTRSSNQQRKIETVPSQMQSQTRSSTSHCDTPNYVPNNSCTVPNDLQQFPPTIEQRDALAMRVYAACQSAGYDEWVRLLDLAPLASQHHLSGYNCIKFGQDGSPYAYLPLSLQQPAQVQEVLEKQKVNEEKASIWLAQKRKDLCHVRSLTKSPSTSPTPANKAPRLMSKKEDGERKVDSEKMQVENDVRMRDASPAPTKRNEGGEKCEACKADTEGSMKTSFLCECGPLKNETVLSSEWEAPIGEDLCKNSKNGTEGSGKTFGKREEANSLSNSNQQMPCQAQINNLSVKTSDTHPISISPIIPPELLEEISKHVERGMPDSIRKQNKSSTLFDQDSSGEMPHDALQVQGERLIRCRVTQVDLCEVAFKAEKELIEAAHNQRKPRALKLNAPPISEPPSEMIRNAIAANSHSNVTVDRGIYCETDCSETFSNDCEGFQYSSDAIAKEVRTDQDVNQKQTQKQEDDTKAFVIGNLLLSSCPGKKVRLTGPVRGRGAICRDLGLDLQRIRQLGVGAIVCCLDDDELAFLGAPWAQYEAEADKLGIEVIRLPMAEGFSPTDVLATDKAISCVVNDYTLNGVHVLVHCRGGVGRAGLIACTWMLKLGLVRSDRDEMHFRVPVESLIHFKSERSHVDHPLTNWQNGGIIGHQQKEITVDIMQTIHRLIETIRRRRSPKAIETAEQVDFLVKYLLYLHEQESKHLSNYADLQLSRESNHASGMAQTA